MKRREFCWCLFLGTASIFSGCDFKRNKDDPEEPSSAHPKRGMEREFIEDPSNEGKKEAIFFQKIDNNKIRCKLCFRECVINIGERGFCRNRENIQGTLYTLVYGIPSAVRVDPVEKLPLKHFMPRSYRFNIGTAGCNLRCKYCHNWRLSQKSIEEVGRIQKLPPSEAIRRANERKIPSISFTYNEPTVFFEYMYDIAREAKKNGFNVLLNSNGMIKKEPLLELMNYLDAVNIDLKGFTEDFYESVTGGSLQQVLETINIIKEKDKWLELVNLVVPTLNDDLGEIRMMCRWIVNNPGPETPLHFTRFSPSYKLSDLSPTPVETLENALNIAKEEGIKFVTIGNVPGHKNNSTFCPECGKILIKRSHFSVIEMNIKDGKCEFCNTEIAGVW